MKNIVTYILLIMCVINTSAQTSMSNTTLERIEKLLLHNEIDFAYSLLQQGVIDYGNNNSTYKEDYVAGLVLYNKEIYEESLKTLTIAINKMDSIHIWNCEEYLMVAYYIADSYMHLNQFTETELIISHAFLKCANIYSSCVYAKKMYQLLLSLFEKTNVSPNIIEQVHNEIQKISINIYCLNNQSSNAEHIKENFMFWYNYNDTPGFMNHEDSVYVDQGKASYLYTIGEYDEAIRLYERVKSNQKKYPIDNVDIDLINTSLVIMYSSKANIEAVELLLPEIYTYSEILNLGRNIYTENIVIAYYLNKEKQYDLAQEYYERCDSFLNANKGMPNWVDMKANLLSQMVYNCRSLNMIDKMIDCCKEYATLLGHLNYDQRFFVDYNLAYAYSSNENYPEAINILESLVDFVKNNKGTTNMDFVMTNCMLGVSYIRISESDKSIKCTSTAINSYDTLGIEEIEIKATLYHNLGKAYLDKGDFQNALSFLNTAAEMQFDQIGRVLENTQRYIEECKSIIK